MRSIERGHWHCPCSIERGHGPRPLKASEGMLPLPVSLSDSDSECVKIAFLLCVQDFKFKFLPQPQGLKSIPVTVTASRRAPPAGWAGPHRRTCRRPGWPRRQPSEARARRGPGPLPVRSLVNLHLRHHDDPAPPPPAQLPLLPPPTHDHGGGPTLIPAPGPARCPGPPAAGPAGPGAGRAWTRPRLAPADSRLSMPVTRISSEC
jgi:hypothetical protein